MRKVSPRARAAMTIKLCFADADRFPQRRMDEAVAEAEYRARFPWSDAAMIRSTRAIVSAQVLRGRAGWRTMRTIQAPTLVVWGDTDRLVAPDLAEHVAGRDPAGPAALSRRYRARRADGAAARDRARDPGAARGCRGPHAKQM